MCPPFPAIGADRPRPHGIRGQELGRLVLPGLAFIFSCRYNSYDSQRAMPRKNSEESLMKQERPYPIYTVSRKAEHSITLGHPWVYAEEITARRVAEP